MAMALTLKNFLSLKSISVYLALVFVAAFAPSIEGMKCRIMISPPEESFKIFTECHKSNPVDFEKAPRARPNSTWEDTEFDDNCNRQCWYKGVGVLTPEGAVKKDQVETWFKGSELDADVLGKLTAIWNGCVDDTGKVGKEKAFPECKILLMHSICFGERMYKTDGLLERKCC